MAWEDGVLGEIPARGRGERSLFGEELMKMDTECLTIAYVRRTWALMEFRVQGAGARSFRVYYSSSKEDYTNLLVANSGVIDTI